MSFWLSKLLPQLLYPLGLGLLLQSLALLQRRRRCAPGLSATALLLITLPSLPLVSEALLRPLEQQATALTPHPVPPADAVLVLGGGIRPAGPGGMGVEVGDAGDRLLTGVRLMRQGLAPTLITSGGRVSFSAADPTPSEAVLAQQLALELGIPAQAILLNPSSRTTAEEAKAIQALAASRGWQRLLLVTSAFHMRRALASFRHSGSPLEIIPVACDYRLMPSGKPTLQSLGLGLIPSAQALEQSTMVLKEHLGLLIYRLRNQA